MTRGFNSLLAALAFAAPASAGVTPCWVDKGALVAPASFGDIAGDFLIDPSTPVSQLHVTRALSAGLETSTVRRNLRIGGQRVAGFEMTVADLDARTGAFDTTINGVLGADLLGRFSVEFDRAPCRLRLSRARSRPWAGGVRLALRDLGGRPGVEAVVSDGLRARRGWFAIDTGHWTSQVLGARLSHPVGGGFPPPAIRLRALEVGGRLFEQVPAVVAPAADDQSAGSIGMALWSRWPSLRLDMREGWLDLPPRR
jgi:hypothetical protein